MVHIKKKNLKKKISRQSWKHHPDTHDTHDTHTYNGNMYVDMCIQGI